MPVGGGRVAGAVGEPGHPPPPGRPRPPPPPGAPLVHSLGLTHHVLRAAGQDRRYGLGARVRGRSVRYSGRTGTSCRMNSSAVAIVFSRSPLTTGSATRTILAGRGRRKTLLQRR